MARKASVKPSAEIQSAKKSKDYLVVVVKGGEEISVHPSCVEDHKRLGWSVK